MKKLINVVLLAVLALAVSVPASSQTIRQTRQKSQQRTSRQRTSSLSRPSLTATMPVMRVPGTNTTLTGALVYSDLWGIVDSDGNYLYPITSGIYTLQCKPDGGFSSVTQNEDFFRMRAGVKINSTYYVISSSADGTTAAISEYSTNTWYRSRNEEIDYINVPSDLAYDPVTRKVYGAFYDDDTQEYDRFCTFSTSLGEATDIATFERNVFAMAFNDAGELYGIWGWTGWLVKIDTKTGKIEQIGKTGVDPDYNNSMTFGADGVLYWTATDYKGNSALYSVDTKTGAATKIYDMPNNEGFAGLFANTISVPKTAPDAVTDISVTPTSDFATTAMVSFTAPTTTVNGAALSESISAIIAVNGVEKSVIESIQPGQTVTSAEIEMAEGMQTVEITTANETVRGNSASVQKWMGEDLPAAPGNVTAVTDDRIPVLSWTAPTEGQNGGKFDVSTLRYKIVRYPDNTVVAEACEQTQFRDETVPLTLKSVYYDITAYTAKGGSTAVTTPKLAVGGGYTVPFVETFETKDDFEQWTVIDNNGGSQWTYDSQSLFYKYNNDNIAGDDWVISPEIELKKGVKYRLTFDSKTFNSSKYWENFKVAIGDKNHPESMTVLKSWENYISTTYESNKVIFSVDADGKYSIGFYDYSDGKKGWYLHIDNVGVSVVDSRVPAAVDGLSVTAAEAGALKATVGFTTPTKDADGGDMTESMNVAVYRNDVTDALKTYTDIAPGTALTYLDETMTESKTYTYRVVASNDAGEGAEEKASAFVGVDVPGAVGNVSVVDRDGKAYVSWTAPDKGANGGYFDASKLTYRVLRSDGTVVAIDYASTSFLDENLPVADAQQLIYYVITAYANDVKGSYAVSPSLVFGTPYTAPLTEGFADSSLTYSPWVTESDADMHQSWTLQDSGSNPDTADQNGDRGLVTFHSVGEAAGIHASFSSPKINISSLDNPGVSFWMYHSHEASVTTAERIAVKVSVNGGEWTDVDGAVWQRDNGSTGWQRHSVNLAAYKNSDYVRIAFVGVTAGGLDVHLDNISVANLAAIDAELSSLAGPKKIASGVVASYEAAVTNAGSSDIDRLEVVLSDKAGKEYARQAVCSLKAESQQKVTLETAFADIATYELTATVVCPGDNESLNDAKTMTTSVVAPVVPAPQSTACEDISGTAKITWESPMSKGAITDDVEDYDDWAISGIGDWTMVDLDHDVTYYINKDLGMYQNATSAKAFQVCNAKTLGIDIWDEGTPHSGNKMFMALAGVNYVNNDWMISPMLNGAEQTISFYARSFTLQDTPAERMRVLYSTTDTDPANFVKIHSSDYIELPDQWTEYSYVVPEGARYFAVNCVSDGAFAMFVDDLAFNDLTVPASAVKYYEVYRNGQKLAQTAECVYVDATATYGDTYYVKAVFENDLSADGESVSYSAGGIDDTVVDNVTIISGKQTITVIGATGLNASVVAVDGKTVFEGVVDSDRYDIAVNSGVYIVKVGTAVKKVIVK